MGKTGPGVMAGAVLALCTAVRTFFPGAAGASDIRELAPPHYEVRVEKSEMVAMRDGVRLSTDIYFPAGASGKLPVIRMRTPYGKNRPRERSVAAARMFASRGFVVAVQDTRGRYESEGRFGIMRGDAEDGYDTVDWLASQPWSNNKVGTYGCSYRGALQIYTARLRHPSLAAMIPQAGPGAGLGLAGGEPRYLGIWHGGALELAGTFSFTWYSGSKIHYRPPPGIARETLIRVAPYFNPAPKLPEIDKQAVLSGLPTLSILEKLGGPPTDWEDLVTHKFGDPWWDRIGYFTDGDSVDVPTLGINSWYDVNVGNTLYRFNLFRENSTSERSRGNQFVIISPTLHCASEKASEDTVVGELSMGDARLGHDAIYVAWFDHWLKGSDNGITGMPKVQYYLMGRNEWRGADEWPLPETDFTKYYLHSDGHANSRFGTGALAVSPPGKDAAADRFVYDPATPVPSMVGKNGSLHGGPGSGPVDQRELETRGDILVYTSEPFPEGLEMTGPLEVVLFVSSSARDTDFTAKLLDLYPDGRAFNLRAGIKRARYREGYEREVWMEPDKVYRLRIPLDPTSNYFAPGHRLRLEISSSNFPRWDRNLNTGGRNYDEAEGVPAANAVHHSPAYPSHIVLPVIPDSAPGG